MDTENEKLIPETERKNQEDGDKNEKLIPEMELKDLEDGDTVAIITIGVRPGFMLRKVGQAYMVMPTGPRMKEYEGMITLNETGAFLFKESQKPNPSKEKLIAACIEEYGATPEEALQAVDMFVIQCGQCGIFEKKSLTVRVEKKEAGTDNKEAGTDYKEAGADNEPAS